MRDGTHADGELVVPSICLINGRHWALSNDEIGTWTEAGLLGPFRAIATNDMGRIAEDVERQLDSAAHLGTMNRHFDLAAIRRLCDRLGFWELVSELLGGKGLVLWRSNVFRGNPALPWHEDSYANLMAGADANVSVLVALTDNLHTNCMLYAPGSHKLSVRQKEQRYGIVAERKSGGNVRYRGTLQPKDYRHLLPRAGECAIFHPALLHASKGYYTAHAEAAARTNLVLRLTTPAMRILPAAYAQSMADVGPALIYRVGPHGSGAYQTPARGSDGQ